MCAHQAAGQGRPFDGESLTAVGGLLRVWVTPHSTMLDSVAIGASAFLIVLTSVLLVGCPPDSFLPKQLVDLFANCATQNLPGRTSSGCTCLSVKGAVACHVSQLIA